MEEEEKRAARTAQEWRSRAIAWCEFRAESFTHVGGRVNRFDDSRKDYLDASNIIRDAEFNGLRENTGLHLVLPPAQPVRKVSARETALINTCPRKALVSRLLALDATLSDSRILKSLSKEKLARMIVEREFVRESHAVMGVRA